MKTISNDNKNNNKTKINNNAFFLFQVVTPLQSHYFYRFQSKWAITLSVQKPLSKLIESQLRYKIVDIVETIDC